MHTIDGRTALDRIGGSKVIRKDVNAYIMYATHTQRVYARGASTVRAYNIRVYSVLSGWTIAFLARNRK